jgi:P-type Ca2+ transporter type 2C
VLDLGPDKPSTTHASVSMTMAFAVVALSAVNLGVVLRREREAPWSSPVFPYMGWIILGWVLTWAAVELGMLQRLLDTESLTGGHRATILGLSLLTPALVWADKAIQLHRQKKARVQTSAKLGAATGQASSSGDTMRHEVGCPD